MQPSINNNTMKKAIILLACLFCLASLSNAQVSRTISVNGLYSPWSTIKLNYNHDGQKGAMYNCIYKPQIGGALTYESDFAMLEVAISSGQLSSIVEGEFPIKQWNVDMFKPATSFGATYYRRVNLLGENGRFQLPAYFGGGLNYSVAEPVKLISLNLAAKLRARFYITDTIGIYAGIGWNGGVGRVNGAPAGVLGYRGIVYGEAGLNLSYNSSGSKSLIARILHL